MPEESDKEEKGLGELPNVEYTQGIPRRQWINPAQPPPKKAPIGTIPDKTKVHTSFDARPINAIDFIHTPAEQTITESNYLYMTYTVPSNRVAILRGFRYQITPQISAAPLSYFTLTFDVNGIFVQGYTGLILGQSLTAYRPCYIIAPENSTIQSRMYFDANIWTLTPSTTETLTYNFEFYGNLLLSRGLPYNIEPGELAPKHAAIYREGTDNV